MTLEKAKTEGGVARRRILIVEDNLDSARVLAALIWHCGHEVRTAADAASALEALAEFSPQIAFIDIGLPAVDGYELARRMRAVDGQTPHLRLIALTGFGDERARHRSREAGFDEHLLKPVALETLQEVVARPLE